MATNFKYSLEKGSKKHFCPDPRCQKKTFVRYVDTETNELLPAEYGRCDRAENCGYHLNPYKDGYAKSLTDQDSNFKTLPYSGIHHKKEIRIAGPVTLPKVVLGATIKNGVLFSNFCQNLLYRIPFPFTPDDVQKVAEMYQLGTVAKGSRKGSVCFPHIDEMGGCRAIQTRAYDLNNHSIKGGTDFIHSIIERHHKKTGTPLPGWLEAYKNNDLLISTLFGAHLLPKYPQNRIAIVEAPKTAIYGTLYFGIPETANDLLWLAATSRGTLTIEKCKAIQGRTVYLFPDLSKDGSTFKLWQTKANEIMKALPGTRIVVSKMLEQMAGTEDREKGADLADIIIKHDWREFRKAKAELSAEKVEVKREREIQLAPDQSHHTAPQKEYTPKQSFISGAWDNDITLIDQYFENRDLSYGPILLNGIHPVTDIKGFLYANLEPARAQNGNPTYLPYLQRVKDLITHLGGLLHTVTPVNIASN